MDVGDGTGSVAASTGGGGKPNAAATAAAAAPIQNVRGQAWRTLGFLKHGLKTSTRAPFLSNLKESWLEHRGPAYFRMTYSYDRRAPKVGV